MVESHATLQDSPNLASLDEAARREQAARLLITPEPGWILNYGTMALLASLIAGLGMRLDSAPIVIGAMLVAPVMRPVLGLGFSCLAAVSASALRRLFAVLAATSVGLVLVGWLLTVVIPSTEVELAGEVLARTAPDIRDLLVAVAAGAVGAFAIMRPRVSDTITGVAIAVALVPPPVAAGIALGEGFGAQALGALLLYGTNLVAIVFGTVATVLALRLVGESPFALSRRRIARSAAVVVVLGLALGIPLAGSFFDAVEEAQVERDRQVQENSQQRLQVDAQSEIQTWIDQSEQPNLEIVSITVPLEPSKGDITLVPVVLLGQNDSYIPALDELSERVSEALDRPVELGIRLVGVSDQVASSFEVQPEDDADEVALRRVNFSEVLRSWTTSSGVPARLIETRIVDDGVLFARLALAGPAPSGEVLHRLLVEQFDEIPQYELVLEDLIVSPPVLRADGFGVNGSLAAGRALVDGREIDQVQVCRLDDEGGVRLRGPADATIEVVDNSMTLIGTDGFRIVAEETVTEQLEGTTSIRAMFDRAAVGLGEVVVAVSGLPDPC